MLQLHAAGAMLNDDGPMLTLADFAFDQLAFQMYKRQRRRAQNQRCEAKRRGNRVGRTRPAQEAKRLKAREQSAVKTSAMCDRGAQNSTNGAAQFVPLNGSGIAYAMPILQPVLIMPLSCISAYTLGATAGYTVKPEIDVVSSATRTTSTRSRVRQAFDAMPFEILVLILGSVPAYHSGNFRLVNLRWKEAVAAGFCDWCAEVRAIKLRDAACAAVPMLLRWLGPGGNAGWHLGRPGGEVALTWSRLQLLCRSVRKSANVQRKLGREAWDMAPWGPQRLVWVEWPSDEAEPWLVHGYVGRVLATRRIWSQRARGRCEVQVEFLHVSAVAGRKVWWIYEEEGVWELGAAIAALPFHHVYGRVWGCDR